MLFFDLQQRTNSALRNETLKERHTRWRKVSFSISIMVSPYHRMSGRTRLYISCLL